MTVSGSSIKKESRNILKSNYSVTFVAVILVMAIWFIFNYICSILSVFIPEIAADVILCVFSVFLFFPVALGFIRFCWRISNDVIDNPASVFYYFSSKAIYFRALKLILSLAVRIGLLYFIFMIPYFALQIITGTWIYEFLDMKVPLWTVNLSNIITILQFLAIVATVFSSLKYYLAPMLVVADENIDAAEAIHFSTVIYKKTYLDFIFLALGLFGWILLSFFVLPLIYTLPYMMLAYLRHCSYAVETFNKDISKMNYDDIPTFIAGA